MADSFQLRTKHIHTNLEHSKNFFAIAVYAQIRAQEPMASRKSAAWTRAHAPEGVGGEETISSLFSVDDVEALIQGTARAGRPISYSEALMALGMRFTRPKMRALCKVLDAVDKRAAARGEPELAVLVVRESDKLPGQGWWVGRSAHGDKYNGLWEGPEAAAHIAKIQRKAFRYWKTKN
jgi:hypothetical protein